MRKSGLVLLVALLLAGVMLFSSCGEATHDSIKFSKIVDGELYADTEPLFSTLTEITELKNMELESVDGYSEYLYLFSTEVESGEDEYTKYVVYNEKTNAVILTLTETEVIDYEFEFDSTNEDEVFFLVYTTTYKKDGDVVLYDDYTESTALYDCTGAQIASVNAYVYSDDVMYGADLLYFDGKCYRFGENGALTYAFDRSPLAGFPEIYHKTGEYYLGYASYMGPDYGLFLIFDAELNRIGEIRVPAYAEMTGSVLASEETLMLQYMVEKDPYTEDYDVYMTESPSMPAAAVSDDDEAVKYDVHTLLISLKNGKSEEIDCAYVLRMSIPIDYDDVRERTAISEKYDFLAYVAPIEDRYMDSAKASVAIIEKNGTFKQIVLKNGEYVLEFEAVSNTSWIVFTASGNSYMVNEKGEILFEVNDEGSNKEYFVAEGKLFNYNGEMVYDYRADGLDLEEVKQGCIIFCNQDNEVICYAAGTATTLIAKDADREFIDFSYGDEYFGIVDYTDIANVKYEFYNGAGSKLLTLDGGEDGYIVDIIDPEGYDFGEGIIRVSGYDLTTGEPTYTYYRLG